MSEWLIQYVLTPAASALVTAMIPLVGVGVRWLLGKIANEKMRAALTMAYDSIEVSVRNVEQTMRPYVASALADGVLTDAEKLLLRTKAVEAVKAEVPQQLATIRGLLGLGESAFEEWLLHRIEAAVLGLPAPAAGIDPAAIVPPGVRPPPCPVPIPGRP